MLKLLNTVVFFFQAEDGIRALVRSRGLGDVYKRQSYLWVKFSPEMFKLEFSPSDIEGPKLPEWHVPYLIVTVSSLGPAMSYDGRPVSNIPMVLRGRWTVCLLYTSDAADDLLCVDPGGRRIMKKKKKK